ncbi:MAG: hypothetical protein ACYC6Y_12080 [Thermoguttaceae bacterium]
MTTPRAAVSSDSSITIETTAIQETVAEMCAGHERLEEFLRDMFGGMHSLADEILRHGRQLDAAEAQRKAGEVEYSDSLGRQRQALETTFERIEQLTARLETSALANCSGTENLQKLAESMEVERASLRAALESSESQSQELLTRERGELEAIFDRIEKLSERLGDTGAGRDDGHEPLEELLAGMREDRETLRAAGASSVGIHADLVRMAEDLAVTRRELTEAREELKCQRELLCQVSSTRDSAYDLDLGNRLDQIEQGRLEWVQERAALETELDAVRNRAAELADTLDGERQRASSERKEWTEELGRMRQLLQSLSQRPAAAVAPAAPAAVPEAVQPDDAQDPVLDSVMAQFEILQKDLARRRKAKPASK